VTFSTTCTTATTTYNSSTNCWTTVAPCSGISGNTFLDGCEYKVPSTGLPGGISNVTWCGNFTASQANCGIQAQWSAACYDQNFSSNYCNIGVKSCDGTSHSNYNNSDCAGTPENYKGTDCSTGKSYLCGGGTGNGGTNYTGSCGSTYTCGSVSTGTAQTCEGDCVLYTVTVTNAAGYSNATGVVLSDLLPPGISFSSDTVSQGSYSSSTGVWSVGTLNSGSTATLTILAKTTTYGVFVNTATVTAVNQNDVNPNPTSSATVIVGASVTGEAFNDLNGDNTIDTGDNGIAGVVVELLNSNNVVIATTTTNSSGDYSFLGVAPGNYCVEFTTPTGYYFSSGTVSSGQCGNQAQSNCNNNWNNWSSSCQNSWNNNSYCGNYGNYDNYGNNCNSYSYSYGGCNYTGYSDYKDCGSGFNYQSCGNGDYSYEYCGSSNNNCGYGSFGCGNNNNNCGNGAGAGSVCVTLTCGSTTGNVDAGMYLPSSLSGYVYADNNKDGTFDSNDQGLAGVTLQLLSSSGSVLQSVTTNSAGYYIFTNLAPGKYSIYEPVSQKVLNAYVTGADDVGTDDGSTDGKAGTDEISQIIVTSGSTGINYDFGEDPTKFGNGCY